MGTTGSDGVSRPTGPIEIERLAAVLREAAEGRAPFGPIGEMELRHLLRVVTECSLLLTDVYSDERIDRIVRPERHGLDQLVARLIEEERRGEGEVFYRVRRLPEDVRLVGDKALFDRGVLGHSEVKGLDLEYLGARAYRMAGEVLELLAEDRRLRRFFQQNRLLVLPLEQEVDFLRQCSDRFAVYAGLLAALRGPGESDPLGIRVPLMAAAEEALLEHRSTASVSTRPETRALVPRAQSADPLEDAYVQAARGEAETGAELGRDELLSAFERMVLFSSLDMDRLHRALSRVVVDQDEAVRKLCDEFSLFAAGTRDLRKPPAYFLVGPTGVGKNHLVESLCRLLEQVWGVEVPLLTIEGPNYTYPSDINELRGATRGFIRSDEEGLLTTFHQRSSRSPFSAILVDEVEKAHPQLRTFFLPILDRGTTTDNRGRVLNFSNSMVFFTSNLGYSDAQQYGSAAIGYLDDASRTEARDRDTRRQMRRALKPEFVNRLGILHFRRLTRDSAERILDLELDRIAARYREVHGLELVLDPTARDRLIDEGFSPQYGARHMASTLESVCNVAIARRVRRDDRRDRGDRTELVGWLRSLREEKGDIDLDAVRRRVLETARAELDYDVLRIEWREGEFRYVPERRGEDATDPGAGS